MLGGLTDGVLVERSTVDRSAGRQIKMFTVYVHRNQYNQVPHLTQDTNGKVTNSQ